MSDKELFLTPVELAGLLKIDEAGVMELLHTGELRGFEVAGRWRVVWHDFEEFLARRLSASSLKTLARALDNPQKWARAIPPEVRAKFESTDYPEGSFGAWLKGGMADETWLRRALEGFGREP